MRRHYILLIFATVSLTTIPIQTFAGVNGGNLVIEDVRVFTYDSLIYEEFYGLRNSVVEKIIKSGEVLVTQEQRSAEQEQKFKQVVDFLVSNSIDPQTGHPHTSERIKNALKQSHVNIKNTNIENQIKDILLEISKIIPIKLETKKVKITVPAIHTGKVYGVISQYKDQEKWLDNGNLEVVVDVPTGIIMDFYDKLNSITQGSALTEEITQE